MKKKDEIDKIVESQSFDLWGVFQSQPQLNYKIPIYQRKYSWGKGDVDKLFNSVLDNGFLSTNSSGSLFPVFLGALILAENEGETTYSPRVDDIVDGQQRMITLVLVIGEILKKLSELSEELKKLSEPSDEIASWLTAKQVIGELQEGLQKCIAFKRSQGHANPQFDDSYIPRLVRDHEDTQLYKSDIADYIRKTVCPEEFEDAQDIDQSLKKNIEHINGHLDKIVRRDFENSKFKFSDLKDTRYQKLVFHNQIPYTQAIGINSNLGKINNSGERIYKEICMLSCFTNYLLYRVIFNKVTIKKKYENMTLSIFQALNTSGQPLTAIQILKPSIYGYFKTKYLTYPGSEEAESMDYVDNYLADIKKTQEKNPQEESKNLVISFLCYTLGKKCSKDLGMQGREICDGYHRIADDFENKRRYVTCLTDIVNYQKTFWWTQDRNLQSKDADTVLCCLRYIQESNTTLTIPILTRYASPILTGRVHPADDYELFADAVKSLSAFMVLRRAITPGTAGIDSNFRTILGKISIWDQNYKHRESFLKKEDLNEELRELLKEKFMSKSIGKEEWLKMATEQAMYQFAKPPTCKFILLCSASGTKVQKVDGCHQLKKNSSPATHENLLTIGQWEHQFYKTVEHVAPQTLGGEWEDKKYQEIYISDKCNRIGNLTLLPSKDNAAAGNASFEEKKKMYKVWIEEDPKRRKKLIDKLDMKKGKSQFSIDEGSPHKNLLEPIVKTERWTLDAINDRSKNLLGLTWDTIAPWLGIEK